MATMKLGLIIGLGTRFCELCAFCRHRTVSSVSQSVRAEMELKWAATTTKWTHSETEGLRRGLVLSQKSPNVILISTDNERQIVSVMVANVYAKNRNGASLLLNS